MRTLFVTVNPIWAAAAIGWVQQAVLPNRTLRHGGTPGPREGRTYTDSSLDFGDKSICEEFFMEVQKALAPVEGVRI